MNPFVVSKRPAARSAPAEAGITPLFEKIAMALSNAPSAIAQRPTIRRLTTRNAAASTYDTRWSARWNHGFPSGTIETITTWMSRDPKMAPTQRSWTSASRESRPPARGTVIRHRAVKATRNT